jgi:hypothetical protein
MGTKYGHWIKPIPAFKDFGQGSYRQGVEMDREFFGFDLNVRMGAFYNSGKLEPFQTQVCDYSERIAAYAHDHRAHGSTLHPDDNLDDV